ncbi:MAG: putative 2OG-Fe(II) oxygenase [Pseudomonadota bacterium]
MTTAPYFEHSTTDLIDFLVENPGDFDRVRVVAASLLQAKQNERLWVICDELRRIGRLNGFVAPAMSECAQLPVQLATIDEIFDFSFWLEVIQIELSDDQLKELGKHVEGELQWSPFSETRSSAGSGRWIPSLHEEDSTLVQEIHESIESQVLQYIKEKAQQSNSEFIQRAPRLASLQSWAISHDSDGHEAWHLHPDGYLSGVLYLNVPRDMQRIWSNEKYLPGSIEFSKWYPFDEHPRQYADRDRIIIRPRSGMLLIFPSYYPHRTWPTGSAEPRTCISFDIVPPRSSE